MPWRAAARSWLLRVRQSASVLDSLGGSPEVRSWTAAGTNGTLDVDAFQKAASAGVGGAATALPTLSACWESSYGLLARPSGIPGPQGLRRRPWPCASREANTVVSPSRPSCRRRLAPRAPEAGWLAQPTRAELRGRSGYLGAFAILKADRGRIALSALSGSRKNSRYLATAFNGPRRRG